MKWKVLSFANHVFPVIVIMHLTVMHFASAQDTGPNRSESKKAVSPTASDQIQTDKSSAAVGQLNENDFDGVIELYQAIPLTDLLETDAFLLGTAQYRKQDFPAAIEAFQRAATSPDSTIASDARFNLGNARYASALDLLDSPAPISDTAANPAPSKSRNEVIGILRAAIDDFRSVI